MYRLAVDEVKTPERVMLAAAEIHHPVTRSVGPVKVYDVDLQRPNGFRDARRSGCLRFDGSGHFALKGLSRSVELPRERQKTCIRRALAGKSYCKSTIGVRGKNPHSRGRIPLSGAKRRVLYWLPKLGGLTHQFCEPSHVRPNAVLSRCRPAAVGMIVARPRQSAWTHS